MSETNVTNVTGTTGAAGTYAGYPAGGAKEAEKARKEECAQKKENAQKEKNTQEAAGQQASAVYEKSGSQKPATYKINRMSSSERADLAAKLQADQESRKGQLASLVSKMMTGQANAFGKSDDTLWKILSGGNFSVDAKTRAQAQADIAEDGYWGVKQTSQRLFDFACALAGDDVDKMKEMQAAMEKGFQKATKTWGGSLPGICHDTIKAANKMFDDYYASKEAQ